jgi:two-component system sensor histidine kinase TctE
MMLASAYVDYTSTIAALRTSYDKDMVREVTEISSCVTANNGRPQFVPASSLEQLLYSRGVSVNQFAIFGSDGKLIAGDAELVKIHHSTMTHGPTFEDVVIREHAYRAVTLNESVPVAFTIVFVRPSADRIDIQHALIGNALLIDFVELNIVLVVAWLSLHIALRPIVRMQHHIEQQSSLQLEKIDASQVPVEIRSFVITLNHLIEMLNATALRQRQFIANAAHQLRTPLSGLQAQLQLLVNKPGMQELKAEVTIIQGTLDRLTRATNQLLSLARAEEMVIGVANRFQKVDLQMLVQQSIELFLDRADLAQIDLGMEAQPAEIAGDINLLEDLLNNLVDNALKYTPAGGQVTVRCGSHEGVAFLEVEDTGSGIPESARTRVRERFYRQPDAAGPGSGLGLAIVDEICRVHRARLVLGQSTNGQGALVKVLFPR